MKILGLSGSPRKDANTDTMVHAVLEGAKESGADVKFFNLTKLNLKGCQGCMYCRTHSGCSIKDDMTSLYKEIENSDAIVIGSPIYMFQMTAQTKTFMDRLFPFLNPDYTAKVNKPTVLVFSQGNIDVSAFKNYFDHISASYKMLGFPVKEVIVEGKTFDKDDVSSRENLKTRLKISGKNIIQKK